MVKQAVYPCVELERPEFFRINRAPPKPYFVDRSHYLAKDVSFVLCSPYFRSFWHTAHVLATTSTKGVAVGFNGYEGYLTSAPDPKSTVFSFFLVFRPFYRPRAGFNTCVFEKPGVLRFNWDSGDSNLQAGVQCWDTTGSSASLRFVSLDPGQWHVVGATIGTRGFFLYVDGRRIDAGAPIVLKDVPARLSFGRDEANTLKFWHGHISVCYTWNRPLGDAEQLALARDPYQILLME